MTRLWSLTALCLTLSGLFWTAPVWAYATSGSAAPARRSPKAQSQWVDVEPRVVRKFSKQMIRMMRAMRKARMARAKSGGKAVRAPFARRAPFAGMARRTGQKPGLSAKSLFKDPIKRMNAGQKERYQKWLGRLMAPCCQHQSLSGHDSPKAENARKKLQSLILSNKDDKAIRVAFTRLYGEKIFSIPPFADIVLYPIFGSVFILFLLVVLIQRWNRRAPESSSQSDVLSLEEEGEFLDE